MNNNRSAHKNNQPQPPAEKPLPRAPDAERFVLGSILLDYRTHGHIIDILSPHDFPDERDRQILSAMVRLRVAGGAIDTVTVANELDQAGHLRNVTVGYLSDLTTGMPLLPNVESYEGILKEKTAQRRLMELGQHLLNQGAAGFSSAEISESTKRVLDAVEARILKPSMGGLTADQLLDSNIEQPSMALEALLEKNALNMTYGAQRSGKTLLTVQITIAIAAGQKTLFDWYRINIEGPTLFIQADDRNRGASMRDILIKSPVSVRGKPFYVVVNCPLRLGDEFYNWLESEIKLNGYVFVAMDSWTALRAERHGGDIVKAEEEELGALSDLAQRTGCTLDLIHHESQSSKRVSSHWTERAGGTFAVGATPAMHVQVSRFPDLEDKAPERLVRARGRHTEGETLAVRFQQETLDHGLIMTGSAAEFYPMLERLKAEFGRNAFKPKDITSLTGMSRQTVTRQIETLRRAGVITKLRFGEYMVGGEQLPRVS